MRRQDAANSTIRWRPTPIRNFSATHFTGCLPKNGCRGNST